MSTVDLTEAEVARANDLISIVQARTAQMVHIADRERYIALRHEWIAAHEELTRLLPPQTEPRRLLQPRRRP